jgi:hypothetical protein
MSTTEETIAAKQRAMIPSRLAKGAAVLGELWRSGVRCLGEWSGVCPCPTPTAFCDAKGRWLGLLRDGWGGPPYVLPWNAPYELSGNESWLVLEAMSCRMFSATGLTARVATPGERALLRVGPRGTCFDTLLDLAAIPAGPDQDAAVDSIVTIQRVLA